MAEPATTSITEDSLKAALTERLGAVHVEVTDMSGGCGQSFTSLVVSPTFAGQPKLRRHRAVNAALRAEIAAIHAWSARCLTPEEWGAEKAKEGEGGGAASAPPLDGTRGGRVEGVDA